MDLTEEIHIPTYAAKIRTADMIYNRKKNIMMSGHLPEQAGQGLERFERFQ
jgi:hypothetical protein